MTNETTRTGQIHRFHDLVAIRLPNGQTEYFTPKEVQAIASALNAAARDIKKTKFIESQFVTRRFDFLPLAEGCHRPDYTQERGV